MLHSFKCSVFYPLARGWLPAPACCDASASSQHLMRGMSFSRAQYEVVGSLLLQRQ